MPRQSPSYDRLSLRRSSSIDEVVDGEVPEISVSSPPRVTGVTKEGLVHWLSLNPLPNSSGSDLVSNADVTNTNANANTNQIANQDLFYSALENPVTPINLTSSGNQDNDDRIDNIQSFIANVSSDDSPTFVPKTSPSSISELQAANSSELHDNYDESMYPSNCKNISSSETQHSYDESMYPSNCKNILSGKIGMWEEEKHSYDYDDEQPFNALREYPSTDTNTTVEGSHSLPNIDSPPSLGIDSKDGSVYTPRGKASMCQSLNIIPSDYCDSNSDQDSDHTDNMQQWDYTSDASIRKNNRSRGKKKFLYYFNIPKPSWGRISSAVVRHAPCFWCCARVEISSTDRVILTKLNILCAILAIYQVLVGVAYCFVTLSQRNKEDTELGKDYDVYRQVLTPNLWCIYTFIPLVAIIGFVVFIILISTVRSIRRVNLQGALRYMWALYWILPLQIFFAFSFIDFHRVTEVSITHLWSTNYMAGFRKLLCESDRQCECAVPLLGDAGEIDLVWCLDTCDSECGEYRETAITKMSALSHILFITNAIVGLVLAALLMLALFLLERIISAPIVKSSKESNIPLWLTFPTICSFLGGFYFMSHSTLSGELEGEQVNKQELSKWIIGVCYMISGAAFLASALLGWFIAAKEVLDNRDKTQKKIAVYLFIGMMVMTIFAIAAILSYSLIDSSSIVKYGLSDEERGKTACFLLDAIGSCSNCNATQSNETLIEDVIKCPEWRLSLIHT